MGILNLDRPEGSAARTPLRWPSSPVPGPRLVTPAAIDERHILRRATLQQNVEFAVWFAYMAVVAVGVFWHESWADEGQAWLLARNQSLGHLLFHAVRYEGSPGLWHTLLWVLARLHVSYTGMHWIAAAIATAGIYVFLRWSPFPLILRILFPLGFWLAYQDAVVARSYVLFAVLAFAAAAILRAISLRSPARPLRSGTLVGLALLLGLMANVSVHGFVASIAFAVVAWVVLHRRSRVGTRVRKALPSVVLCAFWLFAVITAFPPRDVNFNAGRNLERSIDKIRAGFGDQRAAADWKTLSSPFNDVRPGELIPVPPLVIHRTPRQALWHKIGRVLSLLTYPVSNYRWLALAACILIVVHAIVFRAAPGQLGWIGLLPWALMVLVFISMYLAPRHAGVLWESLLSALWLTWPAHPPDGTTRRWLHRLTLAVLILVSVDQVWWTAHSVWADIHGPYSGDLAAARFLRSQPPGARIAGFYYHSVGPEAYFSRPLYFNQPAPWWEWSSQVRVNQQAPATIATHPDIIVVGGWDWSPRNGAILDDWIPADPDNLNRVPLNDGYRVIPYAEAHGYRETHRFCGHAFIRDGYAEHLCQVILQPEPSPAPAAALPGAALQGYH